MKTKTLNDKIFEDNSIGVNDVKQFIKDSIRGINYYQKRLLDYYSLYGEDIIPVTEVGRMLRSIILKIKELAGEDLI